MFERKGRLEDLARSSESEVWLSMTPQTRMEVMGELIVQVEEIEGRDVRQLRLQRSVEFCGRQQCLPSD